jgi:hypothetical protein
MIRLDAVRSVRKHVPEFVVDEGTLLQLCRGWVYGRIPTHHLLAGMEPVLVHRTRPSHNGGS